MYHTPRYPLSFLFLNSRSVKRKKKMPPDVWCLIFWFIFFGWWCSERKHSFMLYWELRLGYYRAVNLHTDKIQLGRMRYKEFFSLRYMKDTIRILSVVHGSTRVRTLSLWDELSVFPCQTERQPQEDEEYFFRHWEKLAALLVGKFQISADCAACCQDFHAPSNRQMCLSNLWSSSIFKCDCAALKTHNSETLLYQFHFDAQIKIEVTFQSFKSKILCFFFFFIYSINSILE